MANAMKPEQPARKHWNKIYIGLSLAVVGVAGLVTFLRHRRQRDRTLLDAADDKNSTIAAELAVTKSTEVPGNHVLAEEAPVVAAAESSELEVALAPGVPEILPADEDTQLDLEVPILVQTNNSIQAAANLLMPVAGPSVRITIDLPHEGILPAKAPDPAEYELWGQHTHSGKATQVWCRKRLNTEQIEAVRLWACWVLIRIASQMLPERAAQQGLMPQQPGPVPQPSLIFHINGTAAVVQNKIRFSNIVEDSARSAIIVELEQVGHSLRLPSE